jgi:hypothetical protein
MTEIHRNWRPKGSPGRISRRRRSGPGTTTCPFSRYFGSHGKTILPLSLSFAINTDAYVSEQVGLENRFENLGEGVSPGNRLALRDQPRSSGSNPACTPSPFLLDAREVTEAYLKLSGRRPIL